MSGQQIRSRCLKLHGKLVNSVFELCVFQDRDQVTMSHLVPSVNMGLNEDAWLKVVYLTDVVDFSEYRSCPIDRNRNKEDESDKTKQEHNGKRTTS